MDVLTLYKGSDTFIELVGLHGQSDGSMIDTADVTVVLYDSGGNPVTGAAWPMTLTYLTNTDGVYRATLPDDLAVVAGQRYRALVTADDGPGRRSQWDVDVICRVRRR